MTEFTFSQHMFDKERRCININVMRKDLPESFTSIGSVPKTVRLVSSHTNNWQYFKYLNTVYKKRTPAGVLPIKHHSYYNADMNVTLYIWI